MAVTMNFPCRAGYEIIVPKRVLGAEKSLI